MNNKAALEMSVQSIVIFIITFIVVGLLIALITTMFENIEDNLGIIETPPTVNPTASKPIAVSGDKLVLRTNRETPVVFGVYLSEPIGQGELLYVEIVKRNPNHDPSDSNSRLWWRWNAADNTDAYTSTTGECSGFISSGFITFATNFGPAPTSLNAGQTMGIRTQVKSGSTPGTYTCFMRVTDGTRDLAFGSFELEIRS
jgi:hypothetical protein